MSGSLRARAPRWPATLLSMTVLLALWGCTGAGGSGDTDEGGQSSDIVNATEEVPPGEECAYGGVKVESGIDENGNGVLDEEEVDSVQYVCDGAPGTLIVTGDEPPGANCPLGGLKLESGLDLDGDGVLDAEEITNTNYLCEGDGGLVVKSPDPPPGPAGIGVIDLSGGTATHETAGDAGKLTVTITPGTVTGHVKVFATGVANAAFALPAFTPYTGGTRLSPGGDLTVQAQESGVHSADEYHTHLNVPGLWLFTGGVDVAVDGIDVPAGVTMTFEAHIDSGGGTYDTVEFAVAHDIVNAGTIRAVQNPSTDDGGHLDLTAGRFLSAAGSLIDLTGVDGSDGSPGGVGGNLTIAADYWIVNEGDIQTRGGLGDFTGAGGSAGTVNLSAGDGLVNAGTIDARGGSAEQDGDASGGAGGAIALTTTAGDLSNSGDLLASGGDADTAAGSPSSATGGAGGTIGLQAGTLGTVRNSGALNADGGDGNAGGGAGGGSRGGGISLASTCGGVINSGQITAQGGDATDQGPGGTGGAVSLIASYDSLCFDLRPDRDVAVSGDIRTSGGDGGANSGAGGDGGAITIAVAALGVAAGQEIVLLGYDRIVADGGAADGDAVTAGNGGTVLFSNGFDVARLLEGGGGGGGKVGLGASVAMRSFSLGTGSSVPPGGGVYNHVEINANGGTATGQGAGGNGGMFQMLANLELSDSPVFEIVANYNDVLLDGGAGTDAGGNTGSVSLFGRNGAENRGGLSLVGGDASADAGVAGSATGVGVQIVSGAGSAVNTGLLDLRGGSAPGDNGLGGDGHYVEIAGATARNEGDIDNSGGAGGATGGVGGDADDIVLLSHEGTSTQTGMMAFAGGGGETPGVPGRIYIDGADLTCAPATGCAP